MDARPALGHEPANGRVRRLCFEELDQGFSGRQAGDPCSVRVIERLFRKTEDIAVERQDLIEGPNRNPDVCETSSAAGRWHAHSAPFVGSARN
jgi:hypothetical protein